MKNMIKKLLRWLGIGLLFCTGIGALYIWARRYTVTPGHIGLVTNESTGVLETLEPGTHLILSWSRRVEVAIPDRENSIATKFGGIEINTAEGIRCKADVDITYYVESPILAYTKSTNYKDRIQRAVTSSLGKIITEDNYNYLALNSEKIARAQTTSINGTANAYVSFGQKLLNEVQAICAMIGIRVASIQLYNIKAQDETIEKDLQQLSQNQIKSEGDLASAHNAREIGELNAQAAASSAEIIAQGEAHALAIRTAAQLSRFTSLATVLNDPVAANIYALDTQQKIAHELSQTQGTLVLGAHSPTFFGRERANRNVVANMAIDDGQDDAHIVQPALAAPQAGM